MFSSVSTHYQNPDLLEPSEDPLAFDALFLFNLLFLLPPPPFLLFQPTSPLDPSLPTLHLNHNLRSPNAAVNGAGLLPRLRTSLSRRMNGRGIERELFELWREGGRLLSRCSVFPFSTSSHLLDPIFSRAFARSSCFRSVSPVHVRRIFPPAVLLSRSHLSSSFFSPITVFLLSPLPHCSRSLFRFASFSFNASRLGRLFAQPLYALTL